MKYLWSKTKLRFFCASVAVILLLSALCLHISPKKVGVFASVARFDAVSAPIIAAEGVNHNYYSAVNGIAFDDTFYYILSDSALEILDASLNFVASSAPIVSPIALACFESLVFVSTPTEVLIYTTENLTKTIQPVYSISAQSLNATNLSFVTLANNTVTALLYVVDTTQGSNSFANFEISRHPLGANSQSFTAGATTFHILLKAPLSTDVDGISAITYGRTSSQASTGLVFSTDSAIYYQSAVSSISLKLFDQEDVLDITFNSEDGEQLIYAKKGLNTLKNGEVHSFSSVSSAITRIFYFKNHILAYDSLAKSVLLFECPSISVVRSIVKSKSSDLGYFSEPTHALSINTSLYAADFSNHRVQIFGDTGIKELKDEANPLSQSAQALAVDSFGNIFVADGSTLREFSPALAPSSSLALGSSFSICDMEFDGEDSLYFINQTDGGIYRREFLSSDNELIISTISQPTRIAINRLSGDLFVLSQDGRIYAVSDGEAQRLTLASSTLAVDLAVDAAGDMYVLFDDNSIGKYAVGSGALTQTALVASYSTTKGNHPIGLTSINISYGQNTFVSRGDLILTDKTASAIRKIERAVLSVALPDGDQMAVDPMDSAPLSSSIRLAKTTTPLCLLAFPTGSAISHIPSGSVVVILEESKLNAAYTRVLLSDLKTQSIVSGYVLKHRLSDFLVESAPKYSVGRILNQNTYIYKYPLTYSPRVEINGVFHTLDKDEHIEIMDFVWDYSDNNSVKWLKIRLNDGTYGFINDGNVINKNFSPALSRPIPNAVIASKNLIGAVVYAKVNGEFVPLGEMPIENGEVITVVGNFNYFDRYTLIRYYSEEFGILECYVETSDIDYQGITAIEVVMYILLIISILSLIPLIKRVYFTKSLLDN